MKLLGQTFLKFTFLAIIFSASLTSAQITGIRSPAEPATQEVAKAQDAVNAILAESGKAFKDGLIAFADDRRSEAGSRFNKSIEVFLYSTLNIQKDQRLQSCYNQLIETVYRIEFPSESQTPQLRSLAATCTWNIDSVLADNVAKVARSGASVALGLGTIPSLGDKVAAISKAGFNNQTFEPSPLDELSRLELTVDEQQVDTNPVAQQQYQYIQHAVANKSLGFSFQVHPMIQQYINYYRGRGRSTMEIGLYRSGMFMRMARRIFREEGVPENVAWLGQVESAWKPSAMSHMAASGLWQFIPGTGTRFGLQRTAYTDERNSFDQATRASARYLKFLANRYGGNWELAMAAYNSGEGNVDKAIRRAGVSNFWVAFPYLPKETRNYVPNILATILIANNPNQYGFGHIRPAPTLTYDQIRVPASTSLTLLAQASDSSVQYLRYLNPNLRSNVTPPTPYIVNVPTGKANDVVALFRRIPASKISNTNVASSSAGESWQAVANRTGVSVSELMAANPGMTSPKGKVFVPVQGNSVNTIAYSRPSGPQPIVPASNVRVVKAKAGDTVEKIALREKASPTEIAKFNGLLPNSVLFAGREIKIPAR